MSLLLARYCILLEWLLNVRKMYCLILGKLELYKHSSTQRSTKLTSHVTLENLGCEWWKDTSSVPIPASSQSTGTAQSQPHPGKIHMLVKKSVLADHWLLLESFLLLTFTLVCFTYVNPAFVRILSWIYYLCNKHQVQIISNTVKDTYPK